MFYFEKLPDYLSYICLWLTIDIFYLENTMVFMLVICSFVVFIRHTLKANPWNYCLALKQSVAQKRLGTACLEHHLWVKKERNKQLQETQSNRYYQLSGFSVGLKSDPVLT